MRSFRVTTAPAASRSFSATRAGLHAVTSAVASTSKYSPSRPTMSSNSGCDTQTLGRGSAIPGRGDAGRHLAHVATLGAVAKRLVHEHQRQHRLADRRGADADAGIVAAGGDDVDHVAVH